MQLTIVLVTSGIRFGPGHSYSLFTATCPPMDDKGVRGDVWACGSLYWLKMYTGWELFISDKSTKKMQRHPDFKNYIWYVVDGERPNWRSVGGLRQMKSRRKGGQGARHLPLRESIVLTCQW
jgi:hypothetical protein